MRVTNGMMLNTVTRNISLSQERYLAITTMASSGRRLNRPSDDPLGVTKDLGFRATLSEITQFRKNIEQAKSWLTFSDEAMGNINELISSAKELSVQMTNDTYDASARSSAATQVGEIFDQILDAINTQFEGNYLFSGTKTDTKPILVSAIGAVYQGDDSNIVLESEPSSYLRINSKAKDFLLKAVRTLGDGADLNAGLQPNLWLSYLHRGQGLDMGAGVFKVMTLNGEYSIDVSAARNIQDVLTALNGAGIPNFTGAISESANGLTLTDASVHHISANTPLALLNMGQGVDQSPGLIKFSDGVGINVNVDISAAATVGDVVNAINTQLAAAGVANVTASIHADKNSLVITDSNIVPLNLTISEASPGENTVANLGLLGDVTTEFAGEDLRPYHLQVVENAPDQNLAKSLGILQGTEFDIIEGEDLDPNLDYFTLLSSLNNGQGFPLGKIRIVNGHSFQDIDLAPLSNDPSATINDVLRLINSSGIDVEARINSQHTGVTVSSKSDGRSLMVMDADDGHTARDLGIFGSPDLLGNLIMLRKSLERNDATEIGLSLDTFDGALDKVLIERSDVGARVNRAETSSVKLLSFEYQITTQLSNIEDADMTKVITDMAAAESVYQAALSSAARMLQPSLINFLK